MCQNCQRAPDQVSASDFSSACWNLSRDKLWGDLVGTKEFPVWHSSGIIMIIIQVLAGPILTLWTLQKPRQTQWKSYKNPLYFLAKPFKGPFYLLSPDSIRETTAWFSGHIRIWRSYASTFDLQGPADPGWKYMISSWLHTEHHFWIIMTTIQTIARPSIAL